MSDGWFVLGVDGGNTKTTAVVVDSAQRVVGVGDGGCSDIYGTPSADGAFAELTRVVDCALSEAGCVAGEVRAATFSLAGADWPEDYRYLRRRLGSEWSFGCEPLVVNDSIGGLRLGGSQWSGIGIICGTGNAVGARRADGEFFHLGFWPDTIGAVSLSEAALRAVQCQHLGIGPETSLTNRALELFGAADEMDLLRRTTRRQDPMQGSELVQMSPVLLDEADQGDRVALEIVTDAGRKLGGQGRISARFVGLDVQGALVVLGGGLFSHPSMILEEAVMSELPGAVAHRTTLPPVLGALMAALDSIGVQSCAESLNESLNQFRAAKHPPASAK